MNANNSCRIQKQSQLLLAFLMVASVAWLTGCRTAGYRKADAAAWHSEAAAAQVRVASRDLEATMMALTDLVNQPATDAEPQFLKFSGALDQLEDSAKSAGKEVNRLSKDGNTYFKIWDKEITAIQDPATRSLSENRKLEVSSRFGAAIRRYHAAEENLQAFIAYLRDLRKALSTDLTSGGLAAIRPSVSDAPAHAREVRTALAQSADELEALGARTASFRVQEEVK